MLLAEQIKWAADVRAFWKMETRFHMGLSFPLMNTAVMAVKLEDRSQSSNPGAKPQIPDTASVNLLARNHDELTLEMVKISSGRIPMKRGRETNAD